jgi:hypothetical protein
MTDRRKVLASFLLAIAVACAGSTDIASAQQPVRPRVRQGTPRLNRPAKATQKKPARKATRQTERKADQPVEVAGGLG